jgi:hypothetical protein
VSIVINNVLALSLDVLPNMPLLSDGMMAQVMRMSSSVLSKSSSRGRSLVFCSSSLSFLVLESY